MPIPNFPPTKVFPKNVPMPLPTWKLRLTRRSLNVEIPLVTLITALLEIGRALPSPRVS